MKNGKIIVRLKGGMGNQLFCYAGARRLALVNDAELVIDDVTGFKRDRKYRRSYALDHFSIPVRKATPGERMEPFERYRRGLAKFIAGHRPFHERRYVEQEGMDFDPRMLGLIPMKTVYLDGLWQSEKYFTDVEETIRKDLRICTPQNTENREMAIKIQESNSVCVHVRRHEKQGSRSGNHLESGYYIDAVKYILDNVPAPHFYLFSDEWDAPHKMGSLPNEMFTSVSHNRGAGNTYADLWLMSQCRHFIIANSTFSWWGAWLGEKKETIVLAPKIHSGGKVTWPHRGLIPDRWVLVPDEETESNRKRNCSAEGREMFS